MKIVGFLSPHANLRTDAYGGDRDRRMRLAIELAEDARGMAGAQAVVCAVVRFRRRRERLESRRVNRSGGASERGRSRCN
ncbi:hypothetical protein [Mesorhizobium sp. AR07]|uniref:oxidoreductase n=1 Tax=Mesorhizobium sp. AR07 TaxID=2865838 RepID=UPI00215E01F3|nr:hypothetical protein [Mesorhizobium sp. AR07]